MNSFLNANATPEELTQKLGQVNTLEDKAVLSMLTTKPVRVCPGCMSRSITKRLSIKPAFFCKKCRDTFEEPGITNLYIEPNTIIPRIAVFRQKQALRLSISMQLARLRHTQTEKQELDRETLTEYVATPQSFVKDFLLNVLNSHGLIKIKNDRQKGIREKTYFKPNPNDAKYTNIPCYFVKVTDKGTAILRLSNDVWDSEKASTRFPGVPRDEWVLINSKNKKRIKEKNLTERAADLLNFFLLGEKKNG